MKTTVQVRADNGREYVTVYLATQSAVNPAIKTAELMRMVKDGTLQKADPEHPLLYALEGIKNRHAIGESIKSTERVILITRKGTKRCAYIKETADKKQVELADRFLGGYTP
jgi:hypothetical protein